jgi:hypothetical protein
MRTSSFYIWLGIRVFVDVMLCYWAPISRRFGGSQSLHLQGQAAQSIASLGSLAIKLVLLAEPPAAVFANYVECHGQARTKNFCLRQLAMATKDCWNRSPCKRIDKTAPKPTLLQNVWNSSTGLKPLQSAPIARRVRSCQGWLLVEYWRPRRYTWVASYSVDCYVVGDTACMQIAHNCVATQSTWPRL